MTSPPVQSVAASSFLLSPASCRAPAHPPARSPRPPPPVSPLSPHAFLWFLRPPPISFPPSYLSLPTSFPTSFSCGLSLRPRIFSPVPLFPSLFLSPQAFPVVTRSARESFPTFHFPIPYSFPHKLFMWSLAPPDNLFPRPTFPSLILFPTGFSCGHSLRQRIFSHVPLFHP